MKTCRHCGETKPATAEYFHRHPVTKYCLDGLQHYCKPCQCAAMRESYARKVARLVENAPYVPPSIYDVIKVPSLAEMFAYLDVPTAVDYALAA